MIRFLGLCATAAVLTACGSRAESPPGDTPAAERPAVAVSVMPAAASELVETIDVVGSLAPKISADIKSELTGTVTEVYVTQWVSVRKGSPLARLDTSEVDAAIAALHAGQAQAEVAATRARRELDRALQLETYGLITPQALDDARSAREAADAAVAAARAQIRAAEARRAKATIKAPMDGVIAERHVDVGDRVENMGGGDPMFRVVDNRVLDLTVIMPSARLSSLRVGQPIEFTTDAIPGRVFTGRVMFINPAVDQASRSVKVIADVPNPDRTLKGGLFVQGRIVVSARPQVVQLPREALLNWNAGARTADVFVVCDGAAQPRRVRTGLAGGASVEIVEGVSVGEEVVVRGGFALRPGDRVVTSKP